MKVVNIMKNTAGNEGGMVYVRGDGMPYKYFTQGSPHGEGWEPKQVNCVTI